MKQGGFTLFELLVVIALCMMMVGIGVHISRLDNRIWVALQTQDIVMTLHTIQRRAFFEQKKQVLEWASYALFEGVQFGCMSGVQGPPGAPVSVVAEPITFSGKKITFYPEGTVQAGTVYLTDAHQQCSYAVSSAVSVVPLFRRYVYDNKKWVLLS